MSAVAPSAEALSSYALQQWEALLLYLVGAAASLGPPDMPELLQGVAAPPVDIPSLLSAAGLTVKDETTQEQGEPGSEPRPMNAIRHHTRTHPIHSPIHLPMRAAISQLGFQFLLADMYSLLWGVVRQYLTGLGAAAGAGGDGDGGDGDGGDGSVGGSSADDGSGGGGGLLAVAINFLLRLGLQAGRPMCLNHLSGSEAAIAVHMAQLGLLMPVQAPGGDHQGVWLYPTRLAAVLAGGGRAGEASTAAAAAAEDGYVIVESNFRSAPSTPAAAAGASVGGQSKGSEGARRFCILAHFSVLSFLQGLRLHPYCGANRHSALVCALRRAAAQPLCRHHHPRVGRGRAGGRHRRRPDGDLPAPACAPQGGRQVAHRAPGACVCVLLTVPVCHLPSYLPPTPEYRCHASTV